MDLEALRTFIAVVDGGSLQAGAALLNTSRPTVRRRIDELEAAAGVPLLLRNPQGIELTTAGELLVRRGRLILSEAELLLNAVQGMGAEPAGLVRVVAPVGMPPQTMAAAFQALRSRWPKLHFDLRFSEHPLDGLRSGAELALSFDRAPPDGPFDCVDLPSVREWLVANPGYLERHRPITGPDDLAHHPLLMWRNPEGILGVPTLAGALVPVQPVLVSTDIHLLRLMAAGGAGIAWLPDALVPEPVGGRLVPVLPEMIGSRRPVRLVVPKALTDLPKIKVILDAVRGLLAKMPTHGF